MQLEVWQQRSLTQKPLAQISGALVLQRPPSGNRVGVAVGSTWQKPAEPGTRQDVPSGQCSSSQQMPPSSTLHSKPGWHCEVVLQLSPGRSGVGVRVGPQAPKQPAGRLGLSAAQLLERQSESRLQHSSSSRRGEH